MLAAIDVGEIFASKIRGRVVHLGLNVHKLPTLKAEQKEPGEGLVEVLLQTLDNFFEDVGLDAGKLARFLLGLKVLVENHTNRIFRGQCHKLVLFADELPVVHQDAL